MKADAPVRQIDAACPNCGWRVPGCESDGAALTAATEHNQACAAQRAVRTIGRD